MNRKQQITGIFAVLVLMFSVFVMADSHTKAPEMSAEQKAMMEAWTKHATPGEHHKHLAALAGSWKMTAKMYMDPSAPPMESSGTCEYKMSLGDRFLSQHCNGKSMEQPFEGWGAIGYDNTLQKHIAIWMDNMGTSFIPGTGSCDQNGKVIKITGEYPDPVTEKSKKYRYVVTVENENSHKLEWFEAGPDGKEARTMEILYTR